MASTKDRDRVCICLVFGLPGSGKSTLARSLQKESECSIIRSRSRPTTTQKPIAPSSDGPESVMSTSIDLPQTQPMLMLGNILHVEYDNLLSLRPILTATTGADKRSVIENDDEFLQSGFSSQNNNTERPMNTGWWKQERMQVVKLMEVFIRHLNADTNALFPDEKPANVSDTVWTTFLQTVISFLEGVGKEKDEPINVILLIDDNLYLRSMRYEYFKLARQYGCSFCQIFMDCPTSFAIKRNLSRSKDDKVPEEVILRMAEKLERHNEQKFHWEDLTCHMDATQHVAMDQIFELFDKALSCPVEPTHEIDEEEVAKSRQECSASLLHQVDLILRKCISTYMSEGRRSCSTNELCQISKKIPRLKEKIVQDFKDGKYTSVQIKQSSSIQDAAKNSTSDLHLFVKDIFSKEAKKAVLDVT